MKKFFARFFKEVPKKQLNMVMSVSIMTQSDLDAAMVFAMKTYFESGGKAFPKGKTIVYDEKKDIAMKKCLDRFHSEIAALSDKGGYGA